MLNDNNLGFTCGDVLLIPHFTESVLLAGEKGLHRNITRVNVMEVPDVIDWVRSGEFLVTSGFPFQDNPDLITELIPKLVDKGVSAFGIKTKRYIDKIPLQALELAEKLNFPIFELPPSTVFSDVVRDIMERVLVQEARNLSILQSRVQKISQKLLYSEGLEEFLQTLDEILGNPVILLDDLNQLKVSPQAERVIDLLEDSAVLLQLRDASKTGTSFLNIKNRRIRVYISNVNNKQNNQCLLMLFEWNKEYSVVDQLTIDRISVLVGLEMMNINARKEVESKYMDQFLQDWLNGKIGNTADLNMKAEACGYPLGNNDAFVVCVARWLDKKSNASQLQQVVKQNRPRLLKHGIHITFLEGELVFLVSYLHDRNPESVFNNIFQIDDQLQLCIGKIVNSPDKAFESYLQAKKIHHISSTCYLNDRNIRFEKLGVFQLLYLLPECEELMEFRTRFIIPLTQYDKKHSTLLLETLKVYFKNNKNAKKTSKELFAHYNTIIYRIERACDILELDVSNGDDMLLLHLAVKVYEISPENKQNGNL